MKASPSTAELPRAAKLAGSVALLRAHLRLRRLPPVAPGAFADVEEYARVLARHGGVPLERARVLEVGYGPRPWRLLALLANGVDARGIDAEVPILRGSPSEYRDAFRRNGAERTVKSIVRRSLFDRRERRAFADALRARDLAERLDPARFQVGDAADAEYAPGSLDLVFSEDVFEHVPREALARLVPKMASWLSPSGLALIRPNVFTGITGGHLVEWYRHSFELPNVSRRSQPWEHLRQARWHANTYLNRLTRGEYRALFAEHFEILEETVRLPDLGREHLTPEVAAELSAYGPDELFSNQVLWVLRPRRTPC
jgi:Methyltransferase domain